MLPLQAIHSPPPCQYLVPVSRSLVRSLAPCHWADTHAPATTLCFTTRPILDHSRRRWNPYIRPVTHLVYSYSAQCLQLLAPTSHHSYVPQVDHGGQLAQRSTWYHSAFRLFCLCSSHHVAPSSTLAHLVLAGHAHAPPASSPASGPASSLSATIAIDTTIPSCTSDNPRVTPVKSLAIISSAVYAFPILCTVVPALHDFL